MRKQSLQAQHTAKNLRLWAVTEVKSVLPLLGGIVQSLRENWLEMHRAKLQVRRIDARPGRLDRQALIQRQEALVDAGLAEAKLEESLSELGELGIYSLDPVAGLALIPFLNESALAWFVFDLFSPRGIKSWRLHNDSPQTHRPIEEIFDAASPTQE